MGGPYPDRIRLFLRDRGTSVIAQEGKQVRFNALFNRMSARGKYIALCEGDDFWTDPLKLQKQVEFLDKHPECVISFHNAKVIYEDNSRGSYSYVADDQKEISTFIVLLG